MTGELTRQQTAVTELLADGMSCEEIAGTLWITTATVRSHVRHARCSMDANNVAHLVAICLRKGMLR